MTAFGFDQHALDGVLGLRSQAGLVIQSVPSSGVVVLEGRADHIDLTVSANVTLQIASPPNQYHELLLVVRQDATGGFTVAWPSSITWVGATSPSLPLAPSTVNTVRLVTADGGRTWVGITTHAPTVQILTVGSGTYTTPANCTAIRVVVVAAGGGGGASAGSGTQASAASGGASGGWLEKWINAPNATYAYTAGAKGTGGTAGANPGNAGADSTFGAAGTLLTAKGGVGGVAGALSTTVGVKKGGSGGGIATDASAGSGFLPSDGQPGAHGVVATATISVSGFGGSTPWGAGGVARSSDGAGMSITGGYGGGGGGAAVQSVNTARAGGDGADGVIFVTEFYTSG